MRPPISPPGTTNARPTNPGGQGMLAEAPHAITSHHQARPNRAIWMGGTDASRGAPRARAGRCTHHDTTAVKTSAARHTPPSGPQRPMRDETSRSSEPSGRRPVRTVSVSQGCDPQRRRTPLTAVVCRVAYRHHDTRSAAPRRGSTRCSASHCSTVEASNRTNRPILMNGTRRSSTSRRMNRSVTPNRCAMAALSRSSSGSAAPVTSFVVACMPPIGT